MSSRSASTSGVKVTAPARLHLGFLDLNGAIGRRYGSIGLAVDHPATHLSVKRAARHSASGAESDRVLQLLEKFVPAARGGYAVHVDDAIPAHAGLGSGTQLALAVGAAIATLEGRSISSDDLAALGDRGARSGIGLAAFERGGFIVDGGRGVLDHPPPVTLRTDFPDAWRILLILDQRRAGVSGEAEATAFADLPEFPEASAARICHLVLMRLVPGLRERDIGAFGTAISEIQRIVGGYFAREQGGSPWTSPAVGRVAEKMRSGGATGIGQSSWGPTGFAFVDGPEAAERLYQSLVGDAKRDGLDIVVAKGRNAGAMVEMV